MASECGALRTRPGGGGQDHVRGAFHSRGLPPGHLVAGCRMIEGLPQHSRCPGTRGVKLWKPDRDTVQRLHELQVDWPPALCDMRVRLDGERVQLRPCCTSTARRVQVLGTSRG